jgi:hypothetical protein
MAAAAGYWNPAGIAGGFGAPAAIASAPARNAISRMIGYAERPSAIIVRSDDAAFLIGDTDIVQPTRFDVVLKQPVIDVKAMALRSVTLRNLVPNVPSYQRFFYYTVDSRRFVFQYGAGATTTVLPIVRSLADFLAILNQSAAYLVEVPAGVVLTNDYYVANKRFIGAADPLYPFLLTFAEAGSSGRLGASLNPAVGAGDDVAQLGGLLNAAAIFAPGTLINNRRDLTLDTLLGVSAEPYPPVTLVRSAGAQVFPEPAVFDGTQSVYVTINVTSSGATTAANSTPSLLGVFSTNNTPKGQVIGWSAAFPHWIWQVAPTIQEMVVTLLDENLQPFDLPFSCIVEIELALLYADSTL